jgi:Lar family restriction alleviation protein
MTYWIDDDNKSYPLLRCPFCGTESAEMITQEELWGYPMNATRFTVCCSRERGGCGATCGFHETKAHAATRWNTRTVI